MKKNSAYRAAAGLSAVAGIVLPTACAPKAKDEAPTRYNILIIESDDHTSQMISAYGGEIETPNLDRLAEEDGVRFDNAFVVNSISGPSRACLLTGKHSHKNGFTNNEHSVFDGDQQTFPKLLQAAGYQTAIIGKWHLHSLPQGFDHWEILPGQGDYYNPAFITAPNDTVKEKGYVTDLITDKSIDLLRSRDKSRPFMLMVQHKAPHRNWMPRIQDLDLYEDVTFELPENFVDDYAGRPAAARAEMNIGEHMDPAYDCKLLREDHPTHYSRMYEWILSGMDEENREKFLAFYRPMADYYWDSKMTDQERMEYKYQRYMRDYAKVIHPIDEGVGRIIDYLKEEGLWDTTIVLYLGDQGFYMGEHGWFDKRFMYEESMHYPLLMHLPKGLDARGAIKELTQNIDLAPTFLELAGAAIPEDIQGESLVPLLKGAKELPGRDKIYYHFYEYPAEHSVMRHYGVRDERYKLIHFYLDQDFWELYDLQEDPHEMKNIYDDPAYSEIVDRMRRELVEAQTQYEDTLALRLNGF